MARLGVPMWVGFRLVGKYKCVGQPSEKRAGTSGTILRTTTHIITYMKTAIFKTVTSVLMQIHSGAKRTHFFQIIVTFFIFNIKKLC